MKYLKIAYRRSKIEYRAQLCSSDRYRSVNFDYMDTWLVYRWMILLMELLQLQITLSGGDPLDGRVLRG